MSKQTDQIASVIRRAVQEILSRGLNDPRVRGLISVTKVDLTPDLAEAHVFVSILPEEDAELTMHGLRHAVRHVRTEVGRRVRVRRMPQITFRLDQSIKRESRIIAAIDEARRSDRARFRPEGPSTQEVET